MGLKLVKAILFQNIHAFFVMNEDFTLGDQDKGPRGS